MRVNFGFAGSRNAAISGEACEKVTRLMQEFLGYAREFNSPACGFSGEPIRCDLYSGDIFCPEEMARVAQAAGAGTAVVTTSCSSEPEPIKADAVIALDMKKNNLSYPNTVAEYVVNKSDAVFLLWDGEQNFQEGILWTVLQFCKQKQVPYYLVNTRKLEEVSFSSDAYYIPYSPENVRQYVAGLYDHPEQPPTNEPIPLSGLWVKLHDRFIQKYKLKAKLVPYTEDKLLSPDYFAENDPRRDNHRLLTTYFSYYDQKANEASMLYRSSVYFRSILPMLTTVFIAIGFYAETVLTFLLGEYQPLFGLNCWVILAGIGFLIHALLNRYAEQTARNPRVKQLRESFVEARFIAEYLRVAIHSETYGIGVGSLSAKDSPVEKRVLAKLRHIIRQQEPCGCAQDRDVIREAAANLDALIADQKTYHENCINRYALITQRLDKMATALYTAGFVIVVGRGFLQFIVPFVSSGLNLSAAVHGVKIESFLKSFANMLALVVPAWASYFSAKLNRNGYAWLWNNSVNMKAGLEKVEKKLHAISWQDSNSYQVLSDVTQDVMELTREDYTGWYLRTESQGFTRL